VDLMASDQRVHILDLCGRQFAVPHIKRYATSTEEFGALAEVRFQSAQEMTPFPLSEGDEQSLTKALDANT
jgi:hypothetical protein